LRFEKKFLRHRKKFMKFAISNKIHKKNLHPIIITRMTIITIATGTITTFVIVLFAVIVIVIYDDNENDDKVGDDNDDDDNGEQNQA